MTPEKIAILELRIYKLSERLHNLRRVLANYRKKLRWAKKRGEKVPLSVRRRITEEIPAEIVDVEKRLTAMRTRFYKAVLGVDGLKWHRVNHHGEGISPFDDEISRAPVDVVPESSNEVQPPAGESEQERGEGNAE